MYKFQGPPFCPIMVCVYFMKKPLKDIKNSMLSVILIGLVMIKNLVYAPTLPRVEYVTGSFVHHQALVLMMQQYIINSDNHNAGYASSD